MVAKMREKEAFAKELTAELRKNGVSKPEAILKAHVQDFLPDTAGEDKHMNPPFSIRYHKFARVHGLKVSSAASWLRY